MALLRGYVYVIGNEQFGWYKIGMTRGDQGGTERRAEAIQQGVPFKITQYKQFYVEHARAVEAALHKQLSTKNIRGEWFALTPEEVQAITVDEKLLIPEPPVKRWTHDFKLLPETAEQRKARKHALHVMKKRRETKIYGIKGERMALEAMRETISHTDRSR